MAKVTLPEYRLKKYLRQSDLEKFDMEVYRGNIDSLLIASASKFGARLRAAIGAGWFEAPETVKREILQNGRKHYEHLFDGQEVGDMTPAVVWLIGQEIDQIYNDMTTIDPN